MALAHIHYWSPALGKQCAMYVTLPDDVREPLPVVYQLHGLSDDHSMWQRRTSIERYAERYRLMVVMPDGGRSFYSDSELGRWETHLLDTIDFVDRVLPSIKIGAGRAIGGLSMGGYGAMKLGLKHPDRFASVVAHSGCLDMANDKELRGVPELDRLWPRGVPPGDDCRVLARSFAKLRGRRPALRFDCGVDDFLIGQNRAFHAHLNQLGVAHEYAELPGAHSWEYWDQHVDTALQFHRRAFTAAAAKPAPAGARARAKTARARAPKAAR